jgi:CHAT domain-containing protein
LGHKLYVDIFGPWNGLLDKPVWILAPDGPLFELPFATLVEDFQPPSDQRIYVVERHAIRFVPGVSSLSGARRSDLNGPAIGLGDPVYNRADARLTRPAVNSAPPGAPHIELARLVGSGKEIENCARIWRTRGYAPILLQGEAASRKNLTEALRRDPAVLHISAHMLFPPQDSGPGAVALRLSPDGNLDLLSASEIATLRLKLGLVVLNGCSSAHGPILPGAGLMGMTRAWLAAGARAVIVTRWATTDHTEGELFQSLYEHLSPSHDTSRRNSIAELLQQAQMTELRAGGVRANPANWGAYFCVETN